MADADQQLRERGICTHAMHWSGNAFVHAEDHLALVQRAERMEAAILSYLSGNATTQELFAAMEEER